MDTSNPSHDARERVFAAANQLFEEAGRQTMPTVDQVRRLARVDMHAATAAMREWRRQQTAQAAPVAVAVPEAIAQASAQAVAALWMQAQELANQSLREAQAAWDTERAELDQMRVELADAFDAQAAELDLAQARIAALEAEARETAETAAALLEKMRADLAAAVTRADRAEATGAELEHRVADLRGELGLAHADADQVRADLKKIATDAEGLRGELATVRAKMDAAEQAHQEHRKEAAKEAQRCADKVLSAQAERDKIAAQAGEARENAARLSGQLEAVQAQNAALMDALRGKMAGDE
ncbi:DNA-binding protein [Aromatoleum bremense]|uniref:KfrA protein n=1 Tax=Aromatoleum bremense TaxID=76115 RepID=A0ABX1P068_9RHOO|nr:DNA-binding protein [Aromatoleum bremense]NMG17689.1 KfrA protein [Aromatoleum bremense]